MEALKDLIFILLLWMLMRIVYSRGFRDGYHMGVNMPLAKPETWTAEQHNALIGKPLDGGRVAEQAKITKAIEEAVVTARAAIMEHTRGARCVTGNIPCQNCGTGILLYSVAYNGHVHAQCTTAECLNWIE
jgi:hypothetical protein